MSEITANLVKQLREKTGAGMMDCKTALKENNGDIEASIDWLRTKGIAKASKKEGRIAFEGLISLILDENIAAIVEINSETDFVARNEDFQRIVETLTKISLFSEDLEDMKSKKIKDKELSVEDFITEAIASIGEKINLRRMKKIKNETGLIVSYVHNQVCEGMGKIGVLVSLESDSDREKLKDLGKKIAMHVAATNPISIDINEIPEETLEREKKVLSEEARSSGKSEDIVEKITEGRLRKFYEENVLLKQTFVIDGESKIESVLNSLDSPVVIKEFVRMELGEGLVKNEEGFSEEVSSLLS